MALIPCSGLHDGAGALSRRSRGLRLQRCGVCGAHALPVPGAHSCGRVQGVALFRLPWRGHSRRVTRLQLSPRGCNGSRVLPWCSHSPGHFDGSPAPGVSLPWLTITTGRSLSPLTLPGSFTGARRSAVPVPVHSRRVYSHGSRVLHGSPSLTLQRLPVPRRDTHAVTLQGHNGSRLTRYTPGALPGSRVLQRFTRFRVSFFPAPGTHGAQGVDTHARACSPVACACTPGTHAGHCKA